MRSKDAKILRYPWKSDIVIEDMDRQSRRLEGLRLPVTGNRNIISVSILYDFNCMKIDFIACKTKTYGIIIKHLRNALIAQLVEHPAGNRQVTGSSPV